MSKFSMVVRTISSCDAFASESRVSRRVPSIATAASAAITRISATTQPQLRLRPGACDASSRPGIISGATRFVGRPAAPLGVEMISVAGSGLVSMNFVADPSPLPTVRCTSARRAAPRSRSRVDRTGVLHRHHFGGVLLDDRRRFGRGAVLGRRFLPVSMCRRPVSSADSSAVRFPGRALMGSTSLQQSSRTIGVCRLGRRSLPSLVAPRHNRAHDADG